MEDEPTLQRILGSVLGDAGHLVDAVGTAEAALERIESGREVDLVVSDKNLPAMNGLDLLAGLRDSEREQGIERAFIMVTGYASRDAALRVLELGGDGFLIKPFRTLTSGVEAIERVLRGPLKQLHAAGALGRAIGKMLAGEPAPDPMPAVSVVLDDDAVRQRVRRHLTAAGIEMLEPDTLSEQTGPRALIAGRVEDLVAYRDKDPDAALVLIDGAASMAVIIDLIAAGGGALVDPVQIT